MEKMCQIDNFVILLISCDDFVLIFIPRGESAEEYVTIFEMSFQPGNQGTLGIDGPLSAGHCILLSTYVNLSTYAIR